MGSLGGPNGLHPLGCACAVCETGFAPTGGARALADRALLCAEEARGRAAKRLEKQRDRATMHRHLVAATDAAAAKLRDVKLPTPAERAELAQLRAMLCPRKGNGK